LSIYPSRFKVTKYLLLSFSDFVKLAAYFAGGSSFVVWAKFAILYSATFPGSVNPCFTALVD